jgi:hypothetical protein
MCSSNILKFSPEFSYFSEATTFRIGILHEYLFLQCVMHTGISSQEITVRSNDCFSHKPNAVAVAKRGLGFRS